jgi:hypothetical protein
MTGRIQFLEARDRSVSVRLSQIQPDLDSLRILVASLQKDVAATSRRSGVNASTSAATYGGAHQVANNVLIIFECFRRKNVQFSPKITPIYGIKN